MDLPSIDLVVNHIQENFPYYCLGATTVIGSYLIPHIYNIIKQNQKLREDIKAENAKKDVFEGEIRKAKQLTYEKQYPFAKGHNNPN